LAVKITRQPKRIVLIGAPSSAGAHHAGVEKAPAALRAAGLVEQLTAAGFEVSDAGDIPQQIWQQDEESPRARSIKPVLSALNALKAQAEVAVKSGALPLILGGDCSLALAAPAAVRRYYAHVSLVYLDRHGDLNTPATTPSGCLEGMALAHVAGRGAAELVRFWGEPPLVREPDIALFGVHESQLDPGEREFLARSPLRRYTAAEIQRRGAEASAHAALERIHTGGRQFVVHFDVDVVSSEELPAVDFPSAGGLSSEEARHVLGVFSRQPNLAALEVMSFNPERDADGAAARLIVSLLVGAVAERLQTVSESPAAESATESPLAGTEASEAPPPGDLPEPGAVES